MSGVKAEIRGLKEVQAKMKQTAKDLHGGEMYDAMNEAAKTVWQDARLLAPVDSGRLRSSITPEVRTDGKTLEGVVGSARYYAPYMETGTGTPAGHSPHYPPPEALELWAQRHGYKNGMVVARAIWRRGGLKPRKFLQRGYDQNKERIKKMLEEAAVRAVQK